jgi:hypothetical protein
VNPMHPDDLLLLVERRLEAERLARVRLRRRRAPFAFAFRGYAWITGKGDRAAVCTTPPVYARITGKGDRAAVCMTPPV